MSLQGNRWSHGWRSLHCSRSAGTAQAEPYLAAQMGLKCAQCHVNPTGGGMRTVFGNTFAQTTLAQKRIGAEEDLWTGQVMKFLSVGGNARANYN